MRINVLRSTLLLVFRPSHLKELARQYNEHLNSPEAIAAKQEANREVPYHERSIDRIRRGLFYSLLLVLGAAICAAVFGRLYVYLCGFVSSTTIEILQYTGIGIILWATLAKQGWSIQTFDGTTIPERVDDFLYRWLYVVGSFLLALSVTLQLGA